MKILKMIGNWIIFVLTGKGPLADKAVDKGAVDFSGQGRNKYGK